MILQCIKADTTVASSTTIVATSTPPEVLDTVQNQDKVEAATSTSEVTATSTSEVTAKESSFESKLDLNGMLAFIAKSKEWDILVKMEEHGALVITEDLFFNQLGIKLFDWENFKRFPKFLVFFLTKKTTTSEDLPFLKEIFSYIRTTHPYELAMENLKLDITEDLICNKLDIRPSECETYVHFPKILKILLLKELQTVGECASDTTNLCTMFPYIFYTDIPDLGLAQEILNCGIDLNINDCGIKAIEFSLKNKNLEAFEFLLKAGVVVNQKIWQDCRSICPKISMTADTRYLIIKYHKNTDELLTWIDKSYDKNSLLLIVQRMIKDKSESNTEAPIVPVTPVAPIAPIPDKKMYYAIQFNEYPNISFPGFLIFTEGGKWYCGIELTEFVDDFASKSAILSTIGTYEEGKELRKPGFYLL